MRLYDNGDGFTATLSADDTYRWATKPGAAWPCSELRNKRLMVAFDGRGNLVDIKVNGREDDSVSCDELNACLADVVLPKAVARGWALNC